MKRFMTLDLVNVMHDVANFMGGVSNAWCIILRNMSNIWSPFFGEGARTQISFVSYGENKKEKYVFNSH